MLTVKNLHAHYGKSHILRGANLHIGANEIVSVLGRNGSGRSTMLKAMMGIVPPTSGSVHLEGRELAGRLPYQIARSGMAYVPEERLAFTNLTVEENLRMGVLPLRAGRKAWSIDQMFAWFPQLADRRKVQAGNLSGGEQQMLTICRSMLGNPALILIDEPTEGLAPRIVERVMDVVVDIHRAGVSVLLVEQKMAISLKISNRVMVMGHGEIVFEGSPAALQARPDVTRDWLQVG